MDHSGGLAFGGSVGADLHVPLDTTTTAQLLKQTHSLAELPKFVSTGGGISKAERVREWRSNVEDVIAPLHPVYKEICKLLLQNITYNNYITTKYN